MKKVNKGVLACLGSGIDPEGDRSDLIVASPLALSRPALGGPALKDSQVVRSLHRWKTEFKIVVDPFRVGVQFISAALIF